MIKRIEFRAANGAEHSMAEELKQSPLAGLLLDSLQGHEDVFGAINEITVYLSDDGSLGELQIAPACRGNWVPITCIPVNLAMFKENPISDTLRASVDRFFTQYAEAHEKR